MKIIFRAATAVFMSLLVLSSSSARADYSSEFKQREKRDRENIRRGLKKKAIANGLAEIERLSGQKIENYQLETKEASRSESFYYIYVNIYARMQDGRICHYGW